MTAPESTAGIQVQDWAVSAETIDALTRAAVAIDDMSGKWTDQARILNSRTTGEAVAFAIFEGRDKAYGEMLRAQSGIIAKALAKIAEDIAPS